MTRRASGRLYDFAKLRPEAEAVLQHVGRRTWDLVVIDVDGTWVRDAFDSAEEGEAAAAELGVRVHRGWGEPRMSRRMNGRDHWGRSGGQRRAL